MPESRFNRDYFSTNTYEKVSFQKYSQYWFSNRFYAMLARRYAEKGGCALEIGCGLGHLADQLGDDFRVNGVDINPWALQQAQRSMPEVHFGVGSAESLPFQSKSLDLVISKHVVEHLQHPDMAILEACRVLKPNGILILSTPNLDSLLKPLKGKKWIGYQDPTHISLKGPSAWLDLLEQAGMEMIRIFSDGFWDVPYVPVLPAVMQKFLFGAPGGIQALLGIPFLPPRWGESVIFIARKLRGITCKTPQS
jgi:SAM-dependent methyltransferase